MSCFKSETRWHNLYIHVPFCASRCGYCAFYSETCSTLELRRRYIESVERFIAGQTFPDAVSSVYIGGGTPNFLGTAEMERLFKAIYRNVPLTADCEISCELNPELLTESKLAMLNDFAGRLSLGVQSFDCSVRQKLMRHCSDDHLHKALKLLEKRTAKHFNIDLIYGIDGVPWKTFASDMESALACGADHLSCYSLTAEENSLLGLDSPTADEGDSADWWLKIGDFLSDKGLDRYEISNYARKDGGCQHNINIWQGGTLLGVGAGASGFDGIDRYTFADSIEDFIDGKNPEFDRISADLRMLEIFAVNLRTVQGWNKNLWEKRYPGTWEYVLNKSLRQMENAPEWWNIEKDRIALSCNGLLFWDSVAGDILDWQTKTED